MNSLLACTLLIVAVAAAPPANFIIKGLVAPTYVLIPMLLLFTSAHDNVSFLPHRFTPMKDNGDGTTSVDLTRIPALAEYLNNTGVHWIFSAGSTGESVDLTVAERKAMAEAWVKIAPKYGQRVIVHVGADSVVDGGNG